MLHYLKNLWRSKKKETISPSLQRQQETDELLDHYDKQLQESEAQLKSLNATMLKASNDFDHLNKEVCALLDEVLHTVNKGNLIVPPSIKFYPKRSLSDIVNEKTPLLKQTHCGVVTLKNNIIQSYDETFKNVICGGKDVHGHHILHVIPRKVLKLILHKFYTRDLEDTFQVSVNGIKYELKLDDYVVRGEYIQEVLVHEVTSD